MRSNFSGLVTRKSSARDTLLFRIAHNITGDRSGKSLVEIVQTSTMTEEERKPLIKVENDDEETESEPGCTGGLCNPKNCIHRYFPVLFVMCFLSFGKYRSAFFFDVGSHHPLSRNCLEIMLHLVVHAQINGRLQKSCLPEEY